MSFIAGNQTTLEETNDPWIKIYSTPYAYQAEVLCFKLEQNGLPVRIVNKQASVYLLGDIELYTRRSYIIQALHLIQAEDDSND